ncbi:MAG: AAA family ATPase [Acutalibacteraceae bacterium]
MNKFEQIKSEYDSFVLFLHEQIPEIDTESVLTYYTSAILKIWGSNLLYSPDYTDLLSAVCAKTYTIEQVVTAMGCCGDMERRLLIPDFFQKIIDKDVKNGSSNTAEVIDKLNNLLVASAMINGDFTLEEANCLSCIIAGLIAHASLFGVNIPDTPDYKLKITEKNQISYLQNDALLAAARQRKLFLGINKTNSQVDNSLQDLTINDNFVKYNSLSMDESNILTNNDEELSETITPTPEDNETMDSLLAELDGLVGLDSVKQDVHSLINFIKVAKIREKRGMKVPTISYHLVFTGNPGTGKTTVARLVAKLYYQMGILPQGQLVEADRSTLVAGYLGQTAIKTQKVIQQAMGGVLFIDEAYSLAGETDDSYGKEAIETILKAMEDHRNELVVIVAGYTQLMHKFIESNPGLSSRFNKYFEFPDYSGEELLAIFNRFCEKNGYTLDCSASELLLQKFDLLYADRDEHFGNARAARNIFEKSINSQADRIALQENISDADLENITIKDIISATGGNV